jgi:cation:H+ antiporter
LSSSLPLALLLLLLSAAFVYWACEYFVNAVEWLGHKAGVSQNAVGTVLAAFGTALPESVVTLVAVAFSNDPAKQNLGLGAALGGPLVLATIAYPIVGIMLLLTRSQPANAPIDVNRQRLSRDQAAFLLIFAFKIALGFMVFSFKPWLGWLFLAAYVAYSWLEVRLDGDAPEGELEPLLFQRKAAKTGWKMTILQTTLSLVVIFVASHVFVGQLGTVGPALGLPSTLVALLLSPIATELPETMNAIIWIRQGKHRLALSNISGSMMIQATVPTALGLLFTPWLFDGALTIAAAVTATAIAGLLILLRCNALTPVRLALFALGYAAFAIATWLNIQVHH